MAQAIGERRAPFGADSNRSNQLLDRRSFLQFLGLADSSTIPDEDDLVPGLSMCLAH